MTAPILTPRQKQVAAAIGKFWRQNGYGPTVRELMVEFGIASPQGFECHLKILEAKGVIERGENKARSIRLVADNGRCPLCGQATKS